VGDPEGLLRDEIIAKYGAETWARWSSANPEDLNFCFPNGESKRDHLNRIRGFLESFCRSNMNLQRIGVSTHGGSIRRIIDACEDMPSELISVPNCAMYKVCFEYKTSRWIFAGPAD